MFSGVSEPTGNGMSSVDKAKPFDIPKREVWEAFKKVKANHGAAGVDGQTVADFEADLSNNLYKLWNRMSSGSYFPPPVRRVDIPKGDSATETRPLGIPTVADRIAQEVVKRYLEPILEPIFHGTPTDTGPAGRRSMQSGSSPAMLAIYWTLDIDVKGYFDSIDWELLLKAVKRFFKRLLKGLQYVPRVLITDKLRSYGVAKRELSLAWNTGRAAI